MIKYFQPYKDIKISFQLCDTSFKTYLITTKSKSATFTSVIETRPLLIIPFNTLKNVSIKEADKSFEAKILSPFFFHHHHHHFSMPFVNILRFQ